MGSTNPDKTNCMRRSPVASEMHIFTWEIVGVWVQPTLSKHQSKCVDICMQSVFPFASCHRCMWQRSLNVAHLYLLKNCSSQDDHTNACQLTYKTSHTLCRLWPQPSTSVRCVEESHYQRQIITPSYSNQRRFLTMCLLKPRFVEPWFVKGPHCFTNYFLPKRMERQWAPPCFATQIKQLRGSANMRNWFHALQ